MGPPSVWQGLFGNWNCWCFLCVRIFSGIHTFQTPVENLQRLYRWRGWFCKPEVLPQVAPSKSAMGKPPSKPTRILTFHAWGVGVYESVWFLHRLQQRLRFSKNTFQKKKKKNLYVGRGNAFQTSK